MIKGTEADPWERVIADAPVSEPHTRKKTYPVFLPEEVLEAHTNYRLQFPAASIGDAFGRLLASAVDMPFATDHRAPDYALLKRTPVLEKGLDTDAHLWAVNLDQLQVSYETWTIQGGNPPATRTVKALGPRNVSIPVPLGIREMVGRDSGVVTGRFTSKPAVPGKAPEDSWFFAQVTPFQVHVKLSHYNSLVWVTDLRTGNPVPGVDVHLLKDTFKELGKKAAPLAAARTGDDGAAELPGTSTFDPELQMVWADGRDAPCLFVRCQKGGDMAVMPLRYDFQVSSEGANREYIPESLRPLHGHMGTWGATAQGIYKAGDTVQFKIYARNQDNLRFTPPPGAAGVSAEHDPAASPRYHLRVEDPMGKVVHEMNDVALSSFGAFDGEFSIPRNGAVGWYRFALSANFTNEQWEPMRVLVSDFTPSPFKVTADLNGDTFKTGDSVQVTTQAKLHAGGPYTGAAARVVASLEAGPFSPDNPRVKGFQFDTYDLKDDAVVQVHPLHDSQGTLDDQGSLVTTFPVVETPVWQGRLTVESTVRDDRGKSIAARASALCFGRDRYVGLLQEDWTLQENKPARVRVVVVDPGGNVVAGTPIRIQTQYKVTRGARVKGAGDAYLAEFQHTWVDEERLEGVSAVEPVDLQFTPRHAGTLRLTASIEDTQGRTHKTVIQRWVTGRGPVLWESIPGNLLDVYPEKNDYRVGETARFLVQNPFPGGKALITVERFGVIQRWVKTLETHSEILEIPVRPDYLPGFYLSVMVTAPRVEKPMGPGGEDLGKPTYRMGYVRVPVEDPHKEIAVDIHPEQEVYKPRDTVRVNLEARARNLAPGEAPPPVELAVAVLDESVFDLLHAGREAFDPYNGFYGLDDLDLSNYNLLMNLVGREKMELKGADAGGDGGPDLSMRSVFKFVAYWNPSLKTDSEGKASFQFEVPDNLTGWRVIAMAVTPSDRMGLGEKVFRVNQSTEIRPALPNQVTEGDRFDAGFTLMNRTSEARTLEVTLRADGPVASPITAAGWAEAPETPSKPGGSVGMTQQVMAEPFQRVMLRLPLQAAGYGEIAFTVTAGDSKDRDAFKQTLQVLRRQAPETSAAYGMTAAPEAEQSIAFPENMREDTGSVRVQLSPTVLGGLEGAFAFLRDYPYGCWEQKLSRGAMAALYKPLKPYLSRDFKWKDSQNTVRETLAMASEFQAPNGGMTYYIPKDEYADSYLSAFTALAFNWMHQEGYPPPRPVEEKLQAYLLNLLRHDPTPQSFTRSMTATVRAVALAALAERRKVVLADVTRYADHLPSMSLQGKACYLRALLLTGGTPKQQQEALRSILAHGDQSAGGMLFSESLDAGYRLFLASPVRENSVILSTLLAWQAAHPSDPTLGDIPVRLMRTLSLSRKSKSHWLSTQENVFAVKALADFSRTYEKKAPAMTVQAWMDDSSLGEGRLEEFIDPPVVLERPIQKGDAGRRTRVRLKKSGEARLYYSTHLTYSPRELPSAAVHAGIEVHREYSVKRDGSWILLSNPVEIQAGEVVRVDLYVSLPAERFFVVLEDPVPGGLEPVNRDLATASREDAQAGEPGYAAGSYRNRFPDWMEEAASRWSFYHRELRHDAVRFYSERLPAGRYHLSYSAQAVSPGEFQVLPVHAEEMYAPEVFGKGAPAVLTVEER